MCNGSSNRTSQGGRIAILKTASGKEISLLLDEDSAGLTTVLVEGLGLLPSSSSSSSSTIMPSLREATTSAGGESMGEGHRIVIHRDGDLRARGLMPVDDSAAATAAGDDAASILYHFPVERRGRPFRLAMAVDLGVGGMGVVGRRVSLVSGREVVGEGIMGWN